MGPIKWWLEELNLNTRYCFTVLNEWFSTERHPFMTKYFWDGVKFHKGNITKFNQKDYYENKIHDFRFHWRQRSARRLFGIHKAACERFMDLTRLSRALYTSHAKQTNKYWRVGSCRPYYGRWRMLNPPSHPRNPMGKPCEHRFCPWCYLRRLDYIHNLLAADPMISVKNYRDTLVKGIGPHSHVNLLTLDVLDDPRTEAYWTSFTNNILTQRKLNLAKHLFKLMLPIERGYVVGTFQTPLYMEPEDSVVLIGCRIGFLYQGELDSSKLDTTMLGDIVNSDSSNIIKRNNIELSEALRFVMPYPVDFLRSDIYTDFKLEFAQLFNGATMFKKGLPKPKESANGYAG